MTNSPIILPRDLITAPLSENDAINNFRIAETMPDDDSDIFLMIRDLLINEEILAFDPELEYLRPLYDILRESFFALSTQSLSILRLDYSLCPMHSCDYAICFDDDDPECAQIRACFPNHDT